MKKIVAFFIVMLMVNLFAADTWAFIYTVKEGDTANSIAYSFGMKNWKQLKESNMETFFSYPNGKTAQWENPDVIHVGWQLNIPDKNVISKSETRYNTECKNASAALLKEVDNLGKNFGAIKISNIGVIPTPQVGNNISDHYFLDQTKIAFCIITCIALALFGSHVYATRKKPPPKEIYETFISDKLKKSFFLCKTIEPKRFCFFKLENNIYFDSPYLKITVDKLREEIDKIGKVDVLRATEEEIRIFKEKAHINRKLLIMDDIEWNIFDMYIRGLICIVPSAELTKCNFQSEIVPDSQSSNSAPLI